MGPILPFGVLGWGHLNKSTKRSSGPKIDLLGQTKRGACRLDMKNGGVKKSSSFVWTLVVEQNKWKMEKGNKHPTPPMHAYSI